jgi:TIR domain-containing protein/pentapeptide repeat protein
MADVDHLRLLCRGIAAWNEARATASFDPDLSHVEIRDVSLRGADFRATEFDGARLFNIDARDTLCCKARMNGVRADLATFAQSDLAGVELKGADFTRSSFRNADLSGAVTFDLKVRHCDLRHAKLFGAALEAAHFYNSDLAGAAFDDANLEAATLKRVRIDQHTAGRLTGAGARMALIDQVREDEWIDWDHHHGVNGRGESFGRILYRNQVYWISEGRWDFFISHASKDKDGVARPLAEALRDLGQRVWYDEFTIRLGDDLSRVINYGTQSSLFGILVVSKAFFGRRWTEAEAEALQNRRIFVVLHGVNVEELAALRPEMADRLTISTDAGAAHIAEALVKSIRTPRPEDHL